MSANRGLWFRVLGLVLVASQGLPLARLARAGEAGADELCKRGKALTAIGCVDEAIAILTKAIALRPDEPSAFHGRGKAWAKKGDLDKAIADQTTAIGKAPNGWQHYNERGKAWWAKGNMDKARTDFDRAYDLAKKHGPPDSRIRCYHRLPKLHRWRYGSIIDECRTKGEFGLAMACFREAIETHPNSPELLISMAFVHASVPACRDTKEAVRLARRAVELNGHRLFHRRLADIYSEVGDFEMAIKTQRHAIELGGGDFREDPVIRAFRRRIPYTQRERIIDLVGRIKRVRKEPRNAEALNSLAWMYVSVPSFRKPEEALKLALQAVALDRRPAYYLDTLACAYAENGNFPMAIRIEREALAKDDTPHHREMIEAFSHGLTYIQVHFPGSADAQEARPRLKGLDEGQWGDDKLMKIGEQEATKRADAAAARKAAEAARVRARDAMQGKGSIDEALSDYTRAIDATPSDWRLYDDRARAWLVKGDRDR
ncbi:tetratricopeptide repeat protein, partial [Planctomycetota bacterium]